MSLQERGERLPGSREPHNPQRGLTPCPPIIGGITKLHVEDSSDLHIIHTTSLLKPLSCGAILTAQPSLFCLIEAPTVN